MRRWLIIMIFAFVLPKSKAQEVPVTTATEQQLESITEANEDAETEDDSFLQELAQFLRNPVNLNEADEQQLQSLRFLSPVQISNFLRYREALGRLIDIYELQAIPGWNVQTIAKVRPYVTVQNTVSLSNSILNRFKGGNQSILLRFSQTLEKSKGFLLDSTKATNFYPGSPQRVLLRYKYNYKNLLQCGIVGEKDAGEQFFKGGQKQGFDFYSAHFFLRKVGIFKAIALGDYTVNMGQGLIQWQSLAFRKGPDVLAAKRQSPVLKPYNSPGEINFHRGAAVTIGRKSWEASFFGSYRKLDANFIEGDTSTTEDDYVSSLQISGYHRTASEVSDKGSQTQLAFGGNISKRFDRLKIGLNAIQYRFKLPLIKADDPYNRFALSDKNLGNYSFDYSYTYKNMHFFGEAALNNEKYPAVVSGMLISTASNIDMSVFYRNISKGYQSLYSNAFTESTYPTNEKGLFTGISIKSFPFFQIDAYADFFRFPFLKFRVNAPTNGSDYFIQLQYKPNKQFEIYTRLKRESKPINVDPQDLVIHPVLAQPRKNWRTQMSFKVNPAITLRNRFEAVWFDKGGSAAETGVLLFADILYKPVLKKYSGNIRLQYFETDGYNSRLYAYENDVLYSYSIPVFYDKGYRYYINVSYDITRRLTLWGRLAQTIYHEKDVVGSGLDEIAGNRKTEARLQFLYRF